MVLSMPRALTAPQQCPSLQAAGSGLLALRMACVQGDAPLVRSLLDASWRRRQMDVVLHDDPAVHLAREQLWRQHRWSAGRHGLWHALNHGLSHAHNKEASVPAGARANGAAKQAQVAYVSCLGLSLMAGQPGVAAVLIKGGADKGHAWGTAHGVTLVSAAQLLFLAAPPLGCASVYGQACSQVSGSSKPAPCHPSPPLPRVSPPLPVSEKRVWWSEVPRMKCPDVSVYACTNGVSRRTHSLAGVGSGRAGVGDVRRYQDRA